MALRALVLLCFVSLLMACDLDITVCELPEEDNVCSGPEDCMLLYCGVECCPCPRPASRRQFEGTYCMVPIEEGVSAARQECREAREKNCDGVECRGLTACPSPPTRAACRDGRCQAAYD
jgi:hypothetical protein